MRAVVTNSGWLFGRQGRELVVLGVLGPPQTQMCQLWIIISRYRPAS